MEKLIASMDHYRENVFNALIIDNQNRTFTRRMYLDKKAYGEDNLFLEPQGYLLQVSDYEIEKKKALFEEVKERVLNSEKIGARQQEKAELSSKNFGMRENGGFWYALNGPLIIGVASFDKKEAWRLLQMMTLNNQSKQFPDYWTSYWTSDDSINSSIVPSEGLSSQSHYGGFYAYCAHPHAWILYCYNYLAESTSDK